MTSIHRIYGAFLISVFIAVHTLGAPTTDSPAIENNETLTTLGSGDIDTTEFESTTAIFEAGSIVPTTTEVSVTPESGAKVTPNVSDVQNDTSSKAPFHETNSSSTQASIVTKKQNESTATEDTTENIAIKTTNTTAETTLPIPEITKSSESTARYDVTKSNGTAGGQVDKTTSTEKSYVTGKANETATAKPEVKTSTGFDTKRSTSGQGKDITTKSSNPPISSKVTVGSKFTTSKVVTEGSKDTEATTRKATTAKAVTQGKKMTSTEPPDNGSDVIVGVFVTISILILVCLGLFLFWYIKRPGRDSLNFPRRNNEQTSYRNVIPSTPAPVPTRNYFTFEPENSFQQKNESAANFSDTTRETAVGLDAVSDPDAISNQDAVSDPEGRVYNKLEPVGDTDASKDSQESRTNTLESFK